MMKIRFTKPPSALMAASNKRHYGHCSCKLRGPGVQQNWGSSWIIATEIPIFIASTYGTGVEP